MSKKPKIRVAKNKAKNVETPQLPAMPRQQANHRQVLQFLDSIVAMAPVSRQAHIQAQGALQQLSGAIAELEKLKEDERPREKN